MLLRAGNATKEFTSKVSFCETVYNMMGSLSAYKVHPTEVSPASKGKGKKKEVSVATKPTDIYDLKKIRTAFGSLVTDREARAFIRYGFSLFFSLAKTDTLFLPFFFTFVI